MKFIKRDIMYKDKGNGMLLILFMWRRHFGLGSLRGLSLGIVRKNGPIEVCAQTGPKPSQKEMDELHQEFQLELNR